MNKDKAIQLLERLQDPEPYEPMLTKDAYDAIQMAIDALSANGDTISRKAAIDAIDEIESEIAEGFGFEYEKWRKYFCDLPSAQPEIIRCKDCKYWVPGYITDNDDFIPPKCGKWQQMVGHSSDDYCSLAERREVTT